MAPAAQLGDLLEWCSLDDRLGMVLDTNNELHPRCSDLALYVHHQQAPEFTH
jgi:hypothetical protein